MKQSLQLKMGQHLTMTPQLQQAIRLLQLSTLDLQQEIQTLIDTNPMLELGEDNETPTDGENAEAEPPEPGAEILPGEATSATDDFSASDASDFDAPEGFVDNTEWQDSIPEDLSLTVNGTISTSLRPTSIRISPTPWTRLIWTLVPAIRNRWLITCCGS